MSAQHTAATVCACSRSPIFPAPRRACGISGRSRSAPTRCASSPASSSPSGSTPGAGASAAARARTCGTSPAGRSSSASSAAGSTTWSPTPSCTSSAGRHPIDAVKIWDGGLGIWGAIALGTLGAWIGCRRKGISLIGVRRRRRARRGPRAGHRPMGQLVQQRALRRPDEPAVEAADPLPRHRRRASRRRCDGHRVQHGARLLPADVPLRVAVGHRARRSRCSCSTGGCGSAAAT